jgi:hypothetical protein
VNARLKAALAQSNPGEMRGECRECERAGVFAHDMATQYSDSAPAVTDLLFLERSGDGAVFALR